MIVICTIALHGTTGLQKSVVECANALHRAGYPIAVLGFLGAGDGAHWAMPKWPLDNGIPALTLQTLAADGGRLLHRNYHPAMSGHMGSIKYEFTANQLASLRQLNAMLTPDDTLIFTSPLPALAFHEALGDDVRRPRTTLQIHGDYQHHDDLWRTMMGARSSIDRVQTVADGLRAQFVSEFGEDHTLFVPNFQGPKALFGRSEHEGVNIVLPASFQGRKNQMDAVRALSMIADESVHLTLWGGANPQNLYYVAVQQLVESLGLDERVHMPGYGTEKDIYSAADIVVMTSLSEGFPYTLTEAAYYGIPTVSYDFEFGPREAIEDGKSGYVVPLGDVAQLAERLALLASDAQQRARFGRRAREIFEEQFSTQAVLARYEKILGPSVGTTIDLVEAFAAAGADPIPADAISCRTGRLGFRRLHRVTVRSTVQLHDVRVDNGKRVRAPRVRRLRDLTRIEFSSGGAEVISYTIEPGSTDRFYLANTTKDNDFEVLPYLRRDANYGDGTPPVEDTIHAAAGGTRRLTGRELVPAFRAFARKARGDVEWKIRQVRANRRRSSSPPQPPAADGTAQRLEQSPVTASPTAISGSGVPGPATLTAAPTSGTARRLVAVYAKAVTTSLIALTKKSGAPTGREVARHPRYAVSAGVDNFGTPINQRGGVAVRNSGTALRPTVRIKGEYDWLLLRDAAAERRIEPPFSYGEFFERVCAAEREHGLFERTTRDGVHLWELGRAAVIIQLAEALGMWGAAAQIGEPVQDVYDGPKRLTTAPPARRVVFDYSRRGGSDYRTAAFRDDETLFVVQPEPDGYPEVNDTNMVYPLREFNQWRGDWRRRWSHLRVPEVDARPFEAALTTALGIRVNLGDHLRNRLMKFLDERDFWTPVFERVQPEEVLISSSHWWAGVSVAASRVGATVSDIQYADTGRYHPTFWFGDRPRYGATRLYAWSQFWAERTNVYQEHVISPRRQPELIAAMNAPTDQAPVWDICVISQPRVTRRILAYVGDIVRERPELRVVIAPHPSQRPSMEADLIAAGLGGRVTISPQDTLTTVRQSEVCVGAYSTSLWEAVSLGRPTYVIPVPGHELTLADVEAGLFRLTKSPHDLVPYEVPATRRTIFGLD